MTVAVFTFLTLRLLTLVKEEDDLKDGDQRKSDTRSDLSQGSMVPRQVAERCITITAP